MEGGRGARSEKREESEVKVVGLEYMEPAFISREWVKEERRRLRNWRNKGSVEIRVGGWKKGEERGVRRGRNQRWKWWGWNIWSQHLYQGSG